MPRQLLLIAILLICPWLGYAQVYQWLDARGNVHFSDAPPPGGSKAREVKEITVPPISTVPAIKSAPVKMADGQKTRTSPYRRFAIVEPANDKAIRQNAGNVAITTSLEPALRPGDTITLFVDGKATVTGREARLLLSNVDRGTHTLRAVVSDSEGKSLISSETVTFHLLRASILLP
jgi:hypothetical protein